MPDMKIPVQASRGSSLAQLGRDGLQTNSVINMVNAMNSPEDTKAFTSSAAILFYMQFRLTFSALHCMCILSLAHASYKNPLLETVLQCLRARQQLPFKFDARMDVKPAGWDIQPFTGLRAKNHKNGTIPNTTNNKRPTDPHTKTKTRDKQEWAHAELYMPTVHASEIFNSIPADSV